MSTIPDSLTDASNYHLARRGAHHHAPRTPHPARHKKTTRSFETIMNDVTRDMPATSRLFSKVVHARVIATISDILGSTFARPNALLMGGIFSFALTLAVYLLAKNLGYSLSGFESIGTFLLGWLIGQLYDYLKFLITGKP